MSELGAILLIYETEWNTAYSFTVILTLSYDSSKNTFFYFLKRPGLGKYKKRKNVVVFMTISSL